MRGLMLELLKSKPGLTQQHLQIIACAGSGKTEFVSHQVIYSRLGAFESVEKFLDEIIKASDLK